MQPAGTPNSVWRRVLARLRPAPIANAGQLRTFLEERAWLITQKCAIDYCRGKTGLASYALFEEKPFQDALAVCQWETFSAVLGDLLLVAEGQLRANAARVPGEALVALYSGLLTGKPAPEHRVEGWGVAIVAFRARLEAAMHGRPLQALDVADHSAKTLFDTLPIHASYRELDEEVVYGAVRFRMIAVSQEMAKRLRPAAVLESLAAQNATL